MRAEITAPLGGSVREARFVARPNRFIVRARLGRRVVDAHLADPGRLKELLLPGAPVWLREMPPSPTRRTRYTAVLVASPDGHTLVSVDTTMANRVVRRALEEGRLEELAGWRLVRAEAPFGASRFDFLLERRRTQLILEVKSVTLVEDGVGLFPDAVTARGARHVGELAELARRRGVRAAVLFVAQREDARCVRAAAHIDPVFAEALAGARRAGVRVLARRCRVTLDGVTLGPRIDA